MRWWEQSLSKTYATIFKCWAKSRKLSLHEFSLCVYLLRVNIHLRHGWAPNSTNNISNPILVFGLNILNDMTITLRSSQQSSSVISYRLMQQLLGGLVGQEERARGRERPDDGGEEAVVEGADALAAHDGAGGGEHGGAGAGDLRGGC